MIVLLTCCQGLPVLSEDSFLSTPETQATENYIREASAAGIIRPSSSPAGVGFFFVEKKDKTLRPCINYRGLSVKNRYPLPLISSPFELLQGATVFTKLDLHNADHLVRIRRGDKWKSAYTPSGHYEYLVMSFGLTNAPAAFQNLANYCSGMCSTNMSSFTWMTS
ncbi:hypothetical protein LDENG_00125130 [Lucifuga dentata]|nr:hypothetical protein LDENG_00125130 [Lucifuga dentata]